jgi:hypothetical protein
MASPVLEALTILHQRRVTRQQSALSEANNTPLDTWLDPNHPLTSEEVRQLAETIYDLLRHELRIERERHRGF